MQKFTLLTMGMMMPFSAMASWGSDTLAELREERKALQKQLRTALPKPEERDPELATLQKKSIDASKAYQKAITAHPRLQEIRKEQVVATDKLAQAIARKDMKARDEAQKEISAVMNRRMEAASPEEDLKPLALAAQQTGEAYNARRRELLATLPETKEAAARLDEISDLIQKKLAEQRNKP